MVQTKPAPKLSRLHKLDPCFLDSFSLTIHCVKPKLIKHVELSSVEQFHQILYKTSNLHRIFYCAY